MYRISDLLIKLNTPIDMNFEAKYQVQLAVEETSVEATPTA